jgi:hypothetical protein
MIEHLFKIFSTRFPSIHSMTVDREVITGPEGLLARALRRLVCPRPSPLRQRRGTGRFAVPWSPGVILGPAIGPFNELTRTVPRSHLGQNLWQMRLLMTRRLASALQPRYPQKNTSGIITCSERGLPKASQSIMSRRCARSRHHFAHSHGAASFFGPSSRYCRRKHILQISQFTRQHRGAGDVLGLHR